LRFNLPVAQGLYAELAPLVLGERLQPGDAAQQFIDELLRLHVATGLPLRLGDAGVTRESLPELARSAMLQQRLLVNNPREVSEADALAIYTAAF
ncbi:MAG: iron-containing alcohol dehydrogenase, partial [Proteobacteria bacterium]